MTNDLTPTNESLPALSADDIALMQGASKTNDFKREDLTIPFLVIVQSTSSYLVRNDPDYIDAAKPGDIIDTMHKVPRQRVPFVPVKYATTYTEWKPNRGGLVKAWGEDGSKYVASGTEFGTRKTAEGNDIVPAATYFGMIINEDMSTTEVVLNMTGSQMKKSRRLANLINMLESKDSNGNPFTPPMFCKVYSLETVQESNELGNWHGWKIEPGPLLLQVNGGKAIFQKADLLRQQLDAGTKTAATPTQAAAPGTPGKDSVDDVPF